jgi:hypothetical protein
MSELRKSGSVCMHLVVFGVSQEVCCICLISVYLTWSIMSYGILVCMNRCWQHIEVGYLVEI